MNIYNLNQIYVFKRDGNSDVNYFSPVSMFFREERWTIPGPDSETI